MSLQPHVTKQPHLVGKLVAPQSTHQSKQTPTRPKHTNLFPWESTQGTASAAALKRSSVWGVNKALPGASGFQAPGRVCL